MYRLALLILFAALSAYRPHRSVWATLACVSAAELVAWGVCSPQEAPLYVIRATAALLGGLALCQIGSRLAFYQASVLLLTLVAYLALSIDVAAGEHVLIYNYFEAVIYGLVALQLVGVFPTIRDSFILRDSSSPVSMGHLQRDKKA